MPNPTNAPGANDADAVKPAPSLPNNSPSPIASVLYKTQSPPAAIQKDSTTYGGAVGAGLALVVLPVLAFIGINFLPGQSGSQTPSTLVLAMVAVFGIMILLGALALVSTLFARLGLSDPSEAMGLPPGSIRAFIALALIVLFGLIAVMLYQSASQNVRIDGLNDEQRSNLVKDTQNHVTAIVGHSCKKGELPVCVEGTQVFTAYIRLEPGSQAADFSKQLLILIGTLMTSVTSFYFASRAGDATTKAAMGALAAHLTGKTDVGQANAGDDSIQHSTSDEPNVDPDGCQGGTENATDDKDLPPAKGGVQK